MCKMCVYFTSNEVHAHSTSPDVKHWDMRHMPKYGHVWFLILWDTSISISNIN